MPESLDKRLLAYALAAGAGLAAAPELAQATIVYTNPADVTISLNNEFIDIDLNNDGTVDARVSIAKFAGPHDEGILAESKLQVGDTGVIGGGTFADNLAAGATIGPLQTFQNLTGSDTRLMARAYAYSYYPYSVDGTSGQFAATEFGYGFLGLTFQIDGVSHFGWAHFNVSNEHGFAGPEQSQPFADIFATLTDFAYESCAGVGISAGATTGGASCPSGVPMPPALALVALGAGGLALWRARRREEQ